jgi:uncharacterized membrane protein
MVDMSKNVTALSLNYYQVRVAQMVKVHKADYYTERNYILTITHTAGGLTIHFFTMQWIHGLLE